MRIDLKTRRPQIAVFFFGENIWNKSNGYIRNLANNVRIGM